VNVVTVVCGSALCTLFARSAHYHLTRRAEFADTLRMQQLRKDGTDRAARLASLVGWVEAAAATFAALTVVWASPPTVFLAAGAAGIALIGLGLLAHVASLLRRGYRGRCGCTPLEAPMSRWSAAPSAVVLLCALGLAFGATRTADAGGTIVAAVVQGVALALLVELLPPSAQPVRGSAAG
jgi:hypothetical protein